MYGGNLFMCEIFLEPIEILSRIDQGKSEMTEWQLGFLCGLIKQKKPKKILEIGVAAGGTTAVILNCVSLLDIDVEVFSIDVNEKLYSDSSKNTGYLAEQCMPYLTKKIKRRLETKGISVEFLESIGKDIDFLILDTMHILPGELLDFLACLPYLAKNCTVVLHDIALHHIGEDAGGYATQVLFDTVVGKKIIGRDPESLEGYPNIGAFETNEDTKKYIENVFQALLLTWRYMPSSEQLRLYRDFYAKHYEKKYIDIFDKALALNEITLKKVKQKKEDEFHEIYELVNICAKHKTYIYGCGKFGKAFYKLLKKCGVDIKGYIITDGNEKDETEQVFYLSEIELNQAQDLILVGVNRNLQKEIKDILEKEGIKNYLLPSTVVCEFIGR